MAKVVVLGGGGGVGGVAVAALAKLEDFDTIVAADLRVDEARRVAAATGDARVRAIAVDASSKESLASAMAGATVVLNCVGPFYRFGPPILEAAIEAGVDYVDICDDLAPTRRMLELDGRAKERGVAALIGMGNSPGLANVFARLCADQLLDQVESVDILHVHGGEPEEGPAVVKHRIHAMTNDVPLFLDGAMVMVRQLEPSGQAHVREVDFRGVGRLPVYPYPHPETITLPQHIPGLRRATNLGVIVPHAYFALTQDVVRLGIASEEPLVVNGQPVIPLDFAVAHILRERPRLLAEAGITRPCGCLKVVASGTKGGKPHSFVFQLSSEEAGAGEGTGIPAAVGATLMKRGRVSGKGVLPPEAALAPFEVLLLALDTAKRMGAGGGDSIRLESIDAEGQVTAIPLAFG